MFGVLKCMGEIAKDIEERLDECFSFRPSYEYWYHDSGNNQEED